MKLINVVGARPQFVKLAPVLMAIESFNKNSPASPITEILVHTGQHYDYSMSQVFFDELAIKKPDHHLGIGSGSHGAQTGQMLQAIEAVLLNEKPDVVVVYGDTNSTLAGALAAAKLYIPVAHVEAGLRSFNKQMPEELNRVLTDHLSSLLFCPTDTAVKHLEREGISEGVHNLGDVMLDALNYYSKRAEESSKILKRLDLQSKKYALATIHRAENTDSPSNLANIFAGLEAISERVVPVILPTHPRTLKMMEQNKIAAKKIRIIEPASYLDMLLLEKHAKFILTDSGGVQKEAFLLGSPCFTLRNETEWPETVESGWNMLVGDRLSQLHVLVNSKAPAPVNENPFGDGHAAEKIVEILSKKIR